MGRDMANFYTYRLEMPDDYCYYGHTANLKGRRKGHKSEAVVGKRPVCVAIRACGWKNVRFVEMREYETRAEAIAVERRSIRFARKMKRKVVNGTRGGETGRGNRLYPYKFKPDKGTIGDHRENSRLKEFI